MMIGKKDQINVDESWRRLTDRTISSAIRELQSIGTPKY